MVINSRKDFLEENNFVAIYKLLLHFVLFGFRLVSTQHILTFESWKPLLCSKLNEYILDIKTVLQFIAVRNS